MFLEQTNKVQHRCNVYVPKNMFEWEPEEESIFYGHFDLWS